MAPMPATTVTVVSVVLTSTVAGWSLFSTVLRSAETFTVFGWS
jgi:hypothetical protein